MRTTEMIQRDLAAVRAMQKKLGPSDTPAWVNALVEPGYTGTDKPFWGDPVPEKAYTGEDQ